MLVFFTPDAASKTCMVLWGNWGPKEQASMDKAVLTAKKNSGKFTSITRRMGGCKQNKSAQS